MTDFIKQIWQMIVDSNLLYIIGAILILLIGWLIALWCSKILSKTLHPLLCKKRELSDGSQITVCCCADSVAGKIVYYVIMIFTLLACFSVLGLHEAAAPLREFITNIAAYTPRIVGALLLTFIAWMAATIVRSASKMLLNKGKLHEHLTQKVHAKDPVTLAEYSSETLYYVTWVLFLPAILNTLQIYGITEPVQLMLAELITYIPNLIAAAAILVIGLWAANLLRKAVSGLVVMTRLEELGKKIGIHKKSGKGGLAGAAGIAAYILVALPVIISALTALQIKVLSDTLAGFLYKLLNGTGDVLGAVLILFGAVWLGRFLDTAVRHFCEEVGMDQFTLKAGFKGEQTTPLSAVLGKLVCIATVVLAAIAACDVLHFTHLAKLLRSFAAFGGNVLLSGLVVIIGIWLAKIITGMLEGKCSRFWLSFIRISVIVFTAALALRNIEIGDTIVEMAFALLLGAFCVAAAIAFGIGGRETAAKLLEVWVEDIRKKDK
jgi:hypothetical protein